MIILKSQSQLNHAAIVVQPIGGGGKHLDQGNGYVAAAIQIQ